MKPKIISWNVRGLNDRAKCRRVGNLLRDWRPALVCLQETKLAVTSITIIRSLWGGSHVGWCCLEADGASGGILIMWDTRVLELVESSVGCFSVSVILKNIEDGVVWGFSGVYGPNADNRRHLLWDELVGMLEWWDLPWCFGGDFTVARFPSERSGSGGSLVQCWISQSLLMRRS
jgi:hypothetical protein